ncbi:hypothetical protein K466DRAFT_462933, partial [Polyporus arcularius HHB13444]
RRSVRHAYCQLCDEAFRSQDTLRMHLKGEHQDRYCDTCDQARLLPSSLFGSDYALKEHHVQSPRHAYCQYCDRHFRTHEVLRQHYREHYVQSPAHAYCQRCNMHFPSGAALFDHYRTMHY